MKSRTPASGSSQQSYTLHWLLLAVAALVFFAVGGARFSHASNDFVPVYTGARCMLHGCNPYATAQLEAQFYAAGGHPDELPSWDIDVPVYPPSTFLVLAPLALLRFPVARFAWFLLNAGLFVTAAVMIIRLCPVSWRWPATVMVSIVVATSGILLVLAQPAIFAISLLAIGAALLLRGRMLPLASVLLLLSLTVKPQIGALVLVYFLARRVQWRYVAAVMVAALAILLIAGGLLHQRPQSAQWMTTLKTNLTSTMGPGGSADPRPDNQQSIGDLNLQAVTSIVSADAHRFNLLAYAVFMALLSAWIVAVWCAGESEPAHLVALAALVVLSLLPVYHRFYDSRLLVLTVPATVLIAQRRRLLGGSIALISLLSVVSVQFRVQAWLLEHGEFQNMLHRKGLFLLLLRQQNLELILLVALYVVALATIRFSDAASWATVMSTEEESTLPSYEAALPHC